MDNGFDEIKCKNNRDQYKMTLTNYYCHLSVFSVYRFDIYKL